jgi:hypothetical protein
MRDFSAYSCQVVLLQDTHIRLGYVSDDTVPVHDSGRPNPTAELLDTWSYSTGVNYVKKG